MLVAWIVMAVILLLGIMLTWTWYMKRRREGGDEQPASPVNPYAAVKIRPIKHQACDAAYEAACRIFLAREAPTLPLRDCGMPNQCRCSYVHYKDRRQGRRRSVNIQTQGLQLEDYPVEREQRDTRKRGRRKTD